MSRLSVRPLSLAILLSIAGVAGAATHTWNGGNTFGPTSMSNALNWSGGAPVSGSPNLNLVFPSAPSNNGPNQNIASPLSLQTMSVTGGYIFSGNGFRFDFLGGPPALSIAAGSSVSFGNSLGFTYPTLVSMGNASNTQVDQLNGADVNFTSNATTSMSQLTLGGSTPNTVGGNIAFTGFQMVVVQKPANVAAFTGNVAVQGGAGLQMQFRLINPNQFAPGTNFAAFSDSMTILFAPQTVNNIEVSGTSSFVNNNGNTLTIQGNISNSGGFASVQNGFVDLNGGTKIVNCSNAAGQLDISSPISNGKIVKTGPGTFSMFNPANTFTGQNVVNGGTLVGNPDSLGTSVLNNSIVQLGTGSLATNLISGPGLVKVGSINFFAAQSYTGGTDVLTQAYGDASTMLGDFTSSSFGEMRFQQITNGTYSGNLSGNLKLVKQGGGILSLNGNNTQTNVVTILDGGLDFQVNNAIGTGNLVMTGTNPSVQATGSVSLPNFIQFFAATNHFVGSGNMTFTNTSPKSLNQGIVHSSTGTTIINGKFDIVSGGSIVVNAGNLVLGDATLVGGFSSVGPITLNGGTLTVNSFNFTTLNDVLLAGGTLNAPNGYAIPLGAALQGNGGVTGRVASANGSTIIATGNLTIGDGSHPAGVNLDGELYTNANTVSLQDSNQSVLGSYTRVGTLTNNGTLSAPKGLVINFGRNIAGRGQVQSNNSLANAVIVNGDASGDSFVDYLEFTGYVKGVGSFNNVAFSGTFAPGLSPALLTVGNVVLTPSNVLDIELGGLNRGSQYDAIDVTGTMALNGQLKLSLINAFVPSLGNQFNIFDGTTVGTFSSYNFPPLTVGLIWDTSLLYTQGIVQIVAVPEPTTLAGLTLLGSLLRRRR